jgi:uncharacterized protein YcfJ
MKAVLAISIFSFSISAMAENTPFETRAKVIRAEPEYETIQINNPETECWDEPVHDKYRYSNSDGIFPMVIGGVLGGVAGHQFGRGRGNDVSTVAGAVIGSVIGHEMSDSDYEEDYRVTSERRCTEIDHWESKQQLTGYRVKYRYAGHNYFTHTREHPGQWLDIRVSIDPLE